jgi:hypothetical protein
MLAAAGLVVLVSGASVEGASATVDSAVVELSSDPHEVRNTSKTGIRSDVFVMILFDIDNDTS